MEEGEAQPEADKSFQGMTIDKKSESCFDRFLFFTTEASLIVSGIPTVILYFLAVVTGILIMTEEKSYSLCIAKEQVKKVLAGKDKDDVSDMLKWHLQGSGICCFVIVIIYGQMLFSVVRSLYKFTGPVFLFVLILTLIYNSVSTSWLSSNECTDTAYYRLAMTNNIIIYFCVFLSLIASIIFCLIGLCTGTSGHKVSAARERPKQESTEQERLNDNDPAKPTRDAGSRTADITAIGDKNKNGEEWGESEEKKDEKSNMGNSWDNINDKEPKDNDEEEIY